MATVTLADDGISSVLSLASSATPRGGVMLMIVTLRRIVYRLRHQSDILGEGGRGWGGQHLKKKNSLEICLSKTMPLHWFFCRKCWSETKTGGWGADGVNVSPGRPDERSPISCSRVKASAPTKSPLSGSPIRRHDTPTHKYRTGKSGLFHPSPS